ncbi:exopolyphosphatase [bacterium]|nr:exopolyphosphatase [bacterium]
MRLFTRNNLDGVVSAALIMKKESVDDVVFASPRAMQDGEIDVQPGDGITNLPYHANAGLYFDHHALSESASTNGARGIVREAPSATHLVFEHYEFEKEGVFGRLHDMVHFTNRLDSGVLTYEDVLNPTGWMLLGFLLDPRTGLELDETLYKSLIHCIRNGMKIKDILAMPEVRDATKRYFDQEEESKIVIASHSKVFRNVLVTDLSNVDEPIVGNRFLLYAIFPRCSASIRVVRHDVKPDTVVFSVGKSVFNRSSKVHIGKLMAEYGGGGLEGAGTCQFPSAEAEEKLAELANRLLD